MKKIWALLSGMFVALALFALAAIAEDNTLSATAPTENTDGSPLTDLASIRVYHRVNGGALSLLDDVPFITPGGLFGYVHTNQLDGVHCYTATAVNDDGQESMMSNEACKTVDTILPLPINDLTVN